MGKHTDFILSPITKILDEVITLNAGSDYGIEGYPMIEYIMQAVFLKMTGSQEQKMKCIWWELATEDYEYRYTRSKTPYGECSRYEEKQNIYRDLIEQIGKYDANYDFSKQIDKRKIRRGIKDLLKNKYLTSELSKGEHSSILDLIDEEKLLHKDQFGTKKELFLNVLQDQYELLYRHRNRCAHNSLSYQENLPTLKTLQHKGYKYDNYFMRFAILILIDELFMVLYRAYLDMLDQD